MGPIPTSPPNLIINLHYAIVFSMKPRKGKKFIKVTSSGKKVSYGAKGYSISPGTSKGDSYCARSAGIARKHPSAKNPDSPNALSRKKWNCVGKKSVKK